MKVDRSHEALKHESSPTSDILGKDETLLEKLPYSEGAQTNPALKNRTIGLA